MKRVLLLRCLILFQFIYSFAQCPDGNNIDGDGDGVVDCIDPCNTIANSIIGNGSFESDLIGWNIPQNQSNFSVTENANESLHGNKFLKIDAPNAATFEGHAIESEQFVLQPNIAYSLRFPVKKLSSADGDAFRWALVDSDGVYRHLNNYYNITTDWETITIDLQINFSNFSNNVFRLRMEFGLSTVDMAVDKIEFFEQSQGFDPAYQDVDLDGQPDCGVVDVSNHPDYNTLVAFYNATNGNNWSNNTNWLDTSQPISSWYGITENNGRVSRLDLNTNQLQGTIPPEIGNLIFLDYLDLRSNFLNGNLPSELGNLQNATWLDFRFNRFEGSIPSSITTLPNLSVFVISNNNLSGDIPDFSNQAMSNLDFLWIDNNQFVFTDFENEFLDYSANIGTGFTYEPQQQIDVVKGIVVDISKSITLETLPNLGTNLNIDWYRTDEIGNFIFLENGLTYNLTVNSTADYGDYYYFVTSNIVTSLVLLSQSITIGPDPSTHPDYNALIALYNTLDGPNWNNPWDITTPINAWDSSQRLQFDAVTNRVTEFDYGGAGLSGIIPPEIGDLTDLKTLIIIGNNISGEIPEEIWTLTKLKMLILGGQQSKQLLLSNGIPPEIANLKDLEWLNLTQIPLTQPLQPELFNLPQLLRLRIVECGLTGTLPAELAGISDVLAIGNEFEGTIPQEFLEAIENSNLSIAGNYFNFSDLKPLATTNNYTRLRYSPQRTQDVEEDITTGVGADLTLNVNDTNINRNAKTTAMNNSYQWYKDDVIITGANEASYTINNAQVADSGVYICEITNTILPDLVIVRAPITVVIDATLDVSTKDTDEISIYPIPAANWLTIKSYNLQDAKVKIFDINGRLIVSEILNGNSNSLNVEHLQSGTYILKIEDKNKVQTKRFVKR